MARSFCRPSLRSHTRHPARCFGRSLLCVLALLPAAPLLAAPPAPTPHPAMVLQVEQSTGIATFAYSPDGQTLATGGDDGVQLWDTASWQARPVLQLGSGSTFAFSPASRTLVAGDGYYGTVRLWDVGSGQLKPGFDRAWGSFAFSPDSKTLATGGHDDKGNPAVLLWRVASE
jgi:hypothetical protein